MIVCCDSDCRDEISSLNCIRLVFCMFLFSSLHCYLSFLGSLDSELAEDMVSCNPDGVLMIHITKLFPSEDAQTFSAFGRVFSGTITKNAHVAVRDVACGCVF